MARSAAMASCSTALIRAFGSVAMVAGCAVAPDRIAATPTEAAAYAGLDCRQLEGAREEVAAQLAEASAQQAKARHDDMVGVLTMGLPMASLNGADRAGEVGRLKGETLAIQRALSRSRCLVALPVISPPE